MLKYKDKSLPIEERTKDLLSRMNIEEKVVQMIGFAPHTKYPEGMLLEDDKINDSVLKNHYMNGIGSLQVPFNSIRPEDKIKHVNYIQKFLMEETRLGIPALLQEECLHGHLAVGATSFPIPLALASTWDREIVEKVYEAAALEARARGGHQAFTPVVDICRDPRWGRIEETFGEDTCLVTEMGVSAVKGLQGTDENNKAIDDNHIVASPKHFVGYAQSDGGRNFAPSHITLRKLHDEILPPFKAVVQRVGALGIMPSHTDIDGVPCHGNKWLLTDLLRDQWGFDGIVVSDYFDSERLNIFHHIVEDTTDAAACAVKAGLDMDVPIGTCYSHLVEAVNRDPEIENYMDVSVSRILKLKFMLGLFDNPYNDANKTKDYINCDKHKKIARKSADEAITLLKNSNNLLPLDENEIKNIAVIGPTAYPINTGGYSSRPNKGISILEGIRKRVDNDLTVNYHTGCNITREKAVGETELDERVSSPSLYSYEEEKEGIKEAVELALKSDVVILCVGGNDLTSREAIFFNDDRGDRANLDLVGQQNKLVEEIYKTRKPIVVVLINGRPLTINYITEKMPAILECWYLGEETGNAVAGAIFGDINPSGKLPVTIPRSVGQLPVYYSQKSSGTFKKYLFEDSTPLFPFGYGLSYTNFEYSNIQIKQLITKACDIKKDKDIIAQVVITVKNVGDIAGDEVIQMYIRDKVCSIVRADIELKDFARLSFDASQTRDVCFDITAEMLKFTDINYKRSIEAGEFEVLIGGNCKDTHNISFYLK